MTGVPDIDSFTLFRCQTDAVKTLKNISPAPQSSSEKWARMKGCE
jgi:hypothetical protein